MGLAISRTLSCLVLSALVLVQPSRVAAGPTTDSKDIAEMDIEELLDVEISVASKKDEPLTEAPSVVSVVGRDEFTVFGDRDLRQLLQRQPSIYTRHSFVYSDNLAGFRGDMVTHAEMHTLVLFNGRPIRESAQSHNVNMYSTFPLTALESIELVRGPGSVLYGSNAFTGVVNLKSRPIPEQHEFAVTAAAGSYEDFETTISAGGRSGDLGYVADVRAASQRGFTYRLADQAGVYGEHNQFDRSVSAAAHLDYQRFTLDVFASDLDAFALGVFPFWSNPHHSIDNKKLFLNAGYRLPLHERMTLEFNATYNLQENSLSSPDPAMIGTNTSDLLGEVTLLANPLDNLNLVVGGLQEYRTNYSPGADLFQSIPPYHYSPASVYAQADYSFNKVVKVVAGTQWNESSQGYSGFVNRYGLILTPRKKWGLKLLCGEAFRAPVTLETDLFDPRGLVGNKNLRPETITTYDAQLFYSDNQVFAAVTYFNSEIEDLIIYDTSVTPMSYMNGGRQTFDGIEFETKYFLTPDCYLLGSFMHQDNETDAGLNPTVAPNNMAKLGLAYTWEGGSAALSYVFFGDPPDIPSAVMVNPAPEPLHLLSLNVRLDASRWMGLEKERAILTLRAENVLNQEVYVPTFAYTGAPNSFPYGPGLTIYAGLTYNF
ncbi:MAG: TonB-dependent receptor [Sedimentisphaerales bacterium]|nr:TonB-dependent receptor [Sedimentisphaerales bacterium]